MPKGPFGGPRPGAHTNLHVYYELEAEQVEAGDIVDVWTVIGANFDVVNNTLRAYVMYNLPESGVDTLIMDAEVRNTIIQTFSGGRLRKEQYMRGTVGDIQSEFKGDLMQAGVSTERFNLEGEQPDLVLTNNEIREYGRERLADIVQNNRISGEELLR